jgi:uncharacterized membrane protein YkoI
MKTTMFLTAAVAAASLVALPALAKDAYSGEKLAPQAKVTLADAQTIALKAHPGQITDKELEKEAGGSGLRWSFDIRSQGKTFEVGVDARTGKVLENKAEGPHPD